MMNDVMSLWIEGLSKLRSQSLRTSISVTGTFDKYLVHAIQFAKVRLTVESASSFEAIDAIPEDGEFRRNGYLESAIFGLLDVLMFAEPNPIHQVRVILEGVEYDRIECSQLAFRLAGRDAGRKVVESAKGRWPGHPPEKLP
jgi:hypothetical protein